jgi:AcrR family transcriptional regulator
MQERTMTAGLEPERGTVGVAASTPTRRLGRAERREQIVLAATRAFARSGFAATGLDDIAAEAGISRVILYRHFDTKADLYRAVLERVCSRLLEACGARDFTASTIPALVAVAGEDPDGFRLLFHHAAREPEFQAEMSQFRTAMTSTARSELADLVPDHAWGQWAAQLTATMAIEAIIAWLDAGRPDPDQAADRIRQALDAIILAAQPCRPPPKRARRAATP